MLDLLSSRQVPDAVTPTPAQQALALADKMYWRLRNRRLEIEKNEAYYQGQQKLTFATDEWMKANGARYDGFSDNWCASVVNAIGERTSVIGLKLRDEDPMIKDAEQARRASGLWDQWLVNEMEAQSSQGFLTSFVAKRSYVLVWKDLTTGNSEMTWEHPSNVEIEYDWMNPRKRKAAIKTWVDETNEYMTLYTPTLLYKWQRARILISPLLNPQSIQMEERGYGTFGVWVPRQPKSDNSWPLPNPMKSVPIVEVPNRPLLRGEPVSEIAGVIPIQDTINLFWAYAIFAADSASMPARVLLGAQPPMRQILDDLGNIIGKEVLTMKAMNESRFAVFSGENAKIDQWDAAQLAVFTDVIEIAVGHIAAQTRTPATYLMANKGLSNVSAEGMESSEAGLANKEIEFQRFAGPNIREIFRLTALAQDDTKLSEEVRLSTVVWQDAFVRSPSQMADALLKKKQMGYPLEWILEQDGVDPYDMQRIKDMIADEQNDPQIQAANRALTQVANGASDGAPAGGE